MPGPSFEDIVSPIGLSLDGEHMVYVAQRGDEFVEVRDHEAGASFPGKRQESYVGQLLTGGACEHVAFEIVRCGRARTGRCLRRVVIDGRAGPEYDAFDITDLEISADAGRYHYRVDGAEGRRDLVVFNGLQTRLYDAVFRGSVDALEDRTIEFVARDGQRFLNVRVTLEQSAALAPPWLSGF